MTLANRLDIMVFGWHHTTESLDEIGQLLGLNSRLLPCPGFGTARQIGLASGGLYAWSVQ